MSKLDNQMSKSLKQIAAHIFEPTNKFGQLNSGVPDFSAQDENWQKVQAQNMSLRCTSSPEEKIKILYFYIPLSSKPVWLKIDHLAQN